MDDPVSKIFGGLAVAGVGALTSIAYKHPNAYKKLFPVLMFIFVYIETAVNAWQFSNFTAHSAALTSNSIAPGKSDEMSNAISAYSIPSSWQFGLITFFIYALILRTLPWWLLDENLTKKEDDQNYPQQDADSSKRGPY